MITAESIRQALQCGEPSCDCHKPNENVHCPAHADSTPSLSVTEKDGKILFHCHGGCPQNRVISALKEKGLWPSSNGGRPQAQRKSLGEPVEVYDYHTEDGELVFQVCRYQTPTGKTFRQRRPDGKGGWVWKMAGVKLVPYRLPMVLKADTVFVVEGEQDVAAIERLGFTATTNPGGAEKWRAEYNRYFQRKAVVILPDNDAPGKAHALDVARQLHGVATSVKVVELPDLPQKGDVSDWIKAGGTVGDLQALVDAAPEWTPPAVVEVEVVATAEGKKQKPTQAEILIKLAGDAELFHDLNQKGFATIEVDGHWETWPIRAKGFKSWLLRQFYQATGKAPGAQAMQDALGLLEAQAHFDGPQHEVHVRVAHVGGKIYVDLANATWEVVEINASGWQVMADPPVKFRRPRGLAAMPTPLLGGSFDDLRPFVNCKADDWPLVVAWILGAFSPGPYPIMIFQGEQGSAKSTAARVLKVTTDPCFPPLRSIPRQEHDLMIMARNTWTMCFDNLSTLPDWLSDALCCIATGGGFGARELYSDDEEALFDAIRPVILNGIAAIVKRQDLADRTMLLELPPIPETVREREKKFWDKFEKARPRILGAIFDAVAMALANWDKVRLPALPRMADFATWVVAAETALPWEAGAFMAAYTANRGEIVELSLAADVVGATILEFMAERPEWTGTPTELFDALENLVPDRTKKSRAWPKATHVLSARLKRLATFLRAVGLEVIPGKSGNRSITIIKGSGKGAQSAQSAQAQESRTDSPDASVDASAGLDASSAQPDALQNEASTCKPDNHAVLDGMDAPDDNLHTLTGDMLEVEL